MRRTMRAPGWALTAIFLSACSGGTSGHGDDGGGGPPPPPAPVPALVSAAAEPALPAGIDAVPARQTTPMRLTGTDLPTVADAALVTVRLVADAPVFAGGTTSSTEVAATATSATSVDFLAPAVALDGLDASLVDVRVAFPTVVLALDDAFSYRAPALAAVSTTGAGVVGASGVLNPDLAPAGAAPIHVFARGGGDPFVLNPAAGRTFGPVPAPAAGTHGGVVEVEFRTEGDAVWPGGHDTVVVPGELVSNGTWWEVRGTSPADRLGATPDPAPLDATVTVIFEDGSRQTVPASPAGVGARFVRTQQRLFAPVAGVVRAFGQDPATSGVTSPVDGSACGAGPCAVDAERNRLYVADGTTIDVFDTARTMGASATPDAGVEALDAGATSPTAITLPGGAVRSLALDAATGQLWAVNDLGVHVVDPRDPTAAVTTIAVPPGYGATTHADRILPNTPDGEMVVSLWDGSGPGVEALMVLDTAARAVVSVVRVPAMTAQRATIAPNGTNLGSSVQQVYNTGGANGSAAQSVATGRISNSLPATTGAEWNREFAVQPSAGGGGRAYLLFDNLGANQGTLIAVNATNGFTVPYDGNASFGSGVGLSIPSDWLVTVDFATGATNVPDSAFAGAMPLGAGALLGPADGQRGAVAWDPARGLVLVHAAATGGPEGFTFVNTASLLPPGFGAPSGPPYTAGTFIANGAALVAMIDATLSANTTVNTPSGATPAFVPSQDGLRVFSPSGGVSQTFTTTSGVGGAFSPATGVVAFAAMGPARGSAQRTATAIAADGVGGSGDGAWYVAGAPLDGDLTEATLVGTTVSQTTSAGVLPAPGPATGRFVATSP